MSSSSESEGDRKIKARSHKRQEEEASEGSEAEAEPDGDTVAVSKKRRVANEVVDPETAAAAQAAGLNIEDFIDPEHDAKRSYNRASAAKSRAKKQKHLEELEAGVDEEEKIHAKLLEKNRELRKDIEEIILHLMQTILAGVVIPDDTLRLLLANEDDEQDNVTHIASLMEGTHQQRQPLVVQENPAQMISRILSPSEAAQKGSVHGVVDAAALQQQPSNHTSTAADAPNNTTQGLLLALLHQSQQSQLIPTQPQQQAGALQQAGGASTVAAAMAQLQQQQQLIAGEESKSSTNNTERPNTQNSNSWVNFSSHHITEECNHNLEWKDYSQALEGSFVTMRCDSPQKYPNNSIV